MVRWLIRSYDVSRTCVLELTCKSTASFCLGTDAGTMAGLKGIYIYMANTHRPDDDGRNTYMDHTHRPDEDGRDTYMDHTHRPDEGGRDTYMDHTYRPDEDGRDTYMDHMFTW